MCRTLRKRLARLRALRAYQSGVDGSGAALEAGDIPVTAGETAAWAAARGFALRPPTISEIDALFSISPRAPGFGWQDPGELGALNIVALRLRPVLVCKDG